MKKILTLTIVSILCLSMFLVLAPKVKAKQTSPSAVPSGFLDYVPIMLNNTQPIPTPVPFQQMIEVNSSTYSKYESSNLQNVEFFYANGTLIPSWLESGNNNTATNTTVYWLSLAGGIAANTSLTVYMGFTNSSTNLFNSATTGEAPDLSLSYGEYDNGPNVFAYYWNFSGPNLPSGWAFSQAVSTQPTPGGYSVNDGASFWTGSGTLYQNPNEIYGYYTTPLEAGSYLVSTRMQSYAGGNNGEGVYFGWWSDPQSPPANSSLIGDNVYDWIWCPNFNPVQPLRIVSNGNTTPPALPNGGYPAGSTLFNALQYMTYRLSWVGSNQTAMLRNATGEVGFASQIAGLPPQGSYYLGFWAPTAGEGNDGETTQWVAVSAMPPNGVMPSVTMGKLEAVPEFPSFLVLPLFMTTTLLATIALKKKRNERR